MGTEKPSGVNPPDLRIVDRNAPPERPVSFRAPLGAVYDTAVCLMARVELLAEVERGGIVEYEAAEKIIPAIPASLWDRGQRRHLNRLVTVALDYQDLDVIGSAALLFPEDPAAFNSTERAGDPQPYGVRQDHLRSFLELQARFVRQGGWKNELMTGRVQRALAAYKDPRSSSSS